MKITKSTPSEGENYLSAKEGDLALIELSGSKDAEVKIDEKTGDISVKSKEAKLSFTSMTEDQRKKVLDTIEFSQLPIKSAEEIQHDLDKELYLDPVEREVFTTQRTLEQMEKDLDKDIEEYNYPPNAA